MSTSHDWRPGVSCLVVDRADMQGGVSAGIPRIHVGTVEENVLQVLHHPVTAHLRGCCICSAGQYGAVWFIAMQWVHLVERLIAD